MISIVKKQLRRSRQRAAGFSLVEILVASFLGVIVMGLMVGSLIMNLRGQQITTTYNENISMANQGLQRIIYGFDGTPGLREANVDLLSIQHPIGGVLIDFGEDGRQIVYNQAAGTVSDNNGVVFAQGVSNFQITQSAMNQSHLTLSITIRDDSLKEPIEQTLTGEVIMRNAEPPPFELPSP